MREFLRVWGIGQSRQEEVGGENAGDEDPAGQLDNSDIQLGKELKFQVQVPQTSAIPLATMEILAISAHQLELLA